MHMLIGAIVYGKDQAEALSRAHVVFGRLTGEGQAFDYYSTFEHPGTPVSGKGRWGAQPACLKASSPDGKALIKSGMKETYQEFVRSMHVIRRVLKTTSDKDIFEDEELGKDMTKYHLRRAGACQGPSVVLYDHDGEGIRSSRHLKNALSRWACNYRVTKNPHEGKDVWVVPADVHY